MIWITVFRQAYSTVITLNIKRVFVALLNYNKSSDMFISYIVICDFWLFLLDAAMSLMDPTTDLEFL